ncbi:MAG: transcriptional regulator [Candidatus Hydrogenedentes bacterium]|nr:transcriptional regulator [Candidatus Hydrogenedentota bacterium]
MSSAEMRLVTIICEELARDTITRFLTDMGVHGYTLFEVEGLGSRGVRTGEMAEFGNIQIEAVMTPDLCERVMNELEAKYFATFGMIAYESVVRVRRREKFGT